MEPTNKELAAIAAIAAHLETCAGVRIVQRSVVTFGKTRLPFVEYVQTLSDVGPGVENVRRMAYATGPLPADYRHRKADAFRLPDGRTVYVAGYLQAEQIATLPEYVRTGPAHVRDANGNPIPNVLFAFNVQGIPGPCRVRDVRQDFAPGEHVRIVWVRQGISGRESCSVNVRAEDRAEFVRRIEARADCVDIVAQIPNRERLAACDFACMGEL